MSNIKYRKGDIFESEAQVIVNTVNCQGVMGKGLALAFKERYPAMFAVYKEECKTGKLRIGRPSLYKDSTPWILNFPTKDKWKANSRLEYLDKGLKYFVTNCKRAGIKSIAFPKLGAQNGKLEWDEVGPLMAKYLSTLNIEVYIYIAEGDREYYGDEQQESYAIAWQRFNEVALSLERLQIEVGLSSREAKKVFNARATKDVLTQADIDNIEKLAKVAAKGIQDYIRRQQYTEQHLPGISYASTETANKPKRKSSPKRNSTVTQVLVTSSSPSLFTEMVF